MITVAMLVRLTLLLVLTVLPVSAATITLENDNKRVPPERSELSIWIRGEITPGDVARLRDRFAEASRIGRPFFAIYLDSPGGSLAEGIRLGTEIRKSGFPTILLSNSTCASACILSFAGGRDRMVYKGARVGVHGASENGRETDAAMIGTLQMARLAAELGVPDSVVARIITTAPDRMHWLGRDDIIAIATRGLIDRYEFGN